MCPEKSAKPPPQNFASRSGAGPRLEAIVDRTGSLLPKDFWPETQLLAIWTGGSAGAYLSTLRNYFGQIPIRDHGLSASEGRMTIPVADASSDGILDVTSHFFEFVPEEEYGRQDALVFEAHELKRGATTTSC